MKMRIAWLAPYPVSRLREWLALNREGTALHACSWILNLSRAIAKRDDIDLHLVTLTAWVLYDQIVSADKITFHVLKNGIPFINRGFPSWMPLDLLSGFRTDARRLGHEIARIKPDVVHAHGTEAAYALGALESKYPTLISIQGIITEYQKTTPCFQFRLLSKGEQKQVRRGKYFGCRTAFDSKFVRRVNPEARIFELHEAMNPIYFRREWRVGDGSDILFVGALTERKGAAFLIEAFAMVKHAIPTATLTLIGDGEREYIKNLKIRATKLGVLADLRFLGHLPPSEIAREHLKAQIFVLPTLNDNSPNTLGEAMVSGMPVIASAVGGIPSMVDDGETGLLVQSCDAKGLADKIVYLLTQKEERTRLGRTANLIARARHNPELVAEETIEAYRQIIDLERRASTVTRLGTT
jgi:glycosyltransferase involved in cell wall biosynthesis